MAPVGVGASASERHLLSNTHDIGADESYGADERSLNSFLKLHSMLSMHATSHDTMQLVSQMFEKGNIVLHDLEIVPKSYDDSMLRYVADMPHSGVPPSVYNGVPVQAREHTDRRTRMCVRGQVSLHNDSKDSSWP